jgi:hypothetical protein
MFKLLKYTLVIIITFSLATTLFVNSQSTKIKKPIQIAQTEARPGTYDTPSLIVKGAPLYGMHVYNKYGFYTVVKGKLKCSNKFEGKKIKGIKIINILPKTFTAIINTGEALAEDGYTGKTRNSIPHGNICPNPTN